VKRRFAKTAFWASAGLLVYSQVGYPALLAALDRLRRPRQPDILPADDDDLPDVSLVVAAYNEEPVIGEKVRNARSLDYPRDRLEVIVSVDGASDGTAARAREAGADVVLENPRGGKIRAQDAAVGRARGEVVAFSDANASWEAGALRALVDPFVDPRVGYVCGDVRFVGGENGTNEEGLYWRYEMRVRELESRLASVTAGNGAIYATRKDAYLVVDPIMGHDLSFPFNLVKRGWRALYAPAARATEKMVPTVEGEFARKRRMMSHTWPIVMRGGMLSPRGYGALYGLMIASHRVLRYTGPLLHLLALGSSAALRREGRVYRLAFLAQLGLLAAAAAGGAGAPRPLLVARYYVLTQSSVAAGLYDWLRHGTPAGWEAAEGTR
jgi:cellulose synthase/poly-beta-1,6-N-acetylglucosamine synthase-like glycosyltransferase